MTRSDLSEGAVKLRVRTALAGFENLYSYWPVPTGFGPSGLDCYICYCGQMIVVETKAPGKVPSPRQDFCIAALKKAGAKVFVIDGTENTDTIKDLTLYLTLTGDIYGPKTLPAGRPTEAGGHSG